MEFVALVDNVYLGSDCVNAVHYIIESVKVDGTGCVGHIEKRVLADNALGVDLQDAFLGNIYLCSANGVGQGDDLSVDIAWRDFVIVDKVYLSDTAPGKYFHDIASNSTDPEYRNPASG